jgi:hypothetical protein
MVRSLSVGLVLGSFALAVTSIFGFAGTPDAPISPGQLPMRFVMASESASGACAGKCRQLISAAGMITSETPRQFLTFVQENALQGAKGVSVVLESDGGSVIGALEFGRAIRRMAFDTTVGHVVERQGRNGAKYSEVTSRADCQSMCAFVLLGGVQRQVPPDARVLVHQIWLGDRRDDAMAANYTAEDIVVVQRDIGSIMQYTAEMGGDMELMGLSLKVPPWEPMRALTREELRRTRLDAPETKTEKPSVIKTAAGPAAVDDDVQRPPANGRGWLVLNHAGQTVLSRTHPLTFEGERLGSFDIFLGCGATPDTFNLTYREIRVGSADRNLPRNLTHVGLVIDDQIQPLKITSTERRTRRSELESIASVVLPARALRPLASDSPASITLETESVGNPRTVTRVGNSGFGHSFREFDKGCAQMRGRADPRVQAEALPADKQLTAAGE